LVFALSAILLLQIVSFGGSSNLLIPKAEATEFLTYEDESTGMKFDYPRELIEDKEKPSDIVIHFQASDYAINYIFQYLPVKVSLNELIDVELEEIKLSFNNFNLEESSPISIGNEQGWKIVYGSTDLGLPLKFMQIIIVKNEAEYIVSFIVPTENYSNKLELFQTVIDSIVIESKEIPILSYENSKYKFTIDHPANLFKYDDPERSIVVGLISPYSSLEDTNPEEVNIIVLEGVEVASLEELVDLMEKEYPSLVRDFKLVESQPTTISGIAAHIIIFSGKIPNPYIDTSGIPVFGDHPILSLVNLVMSEEIDTKGMQIFFIKDDNGYILTYRASPDDYDSFLPEAQKIIDSFVFEGVQSTSTAKIPDWIRNNAEWWAQGAIGDSDFVSGIQYLIKEGIIQIPETSKSSSTSDSEEIPSWIKNNADWWSQGLISDADFVKGIQYLVEQGIIQV